MTAVDRHHNAPEIGALSLQEHATLEAAREALHQLKKTFEHWVTIGRGLEALRVKADRLGGRKTFDRMREKEGLGARIVPKATVTRLFHILDNLTDVVRWRENDLDDRERFNWASPSAVFKHCPVFAKDGGAKKPPTASAATLKRENAGLKAHIADIEAARKRDGSLFDLRGDSAADIAAVIVGNVSAYKAKEIANKIHQVLKRKTIPAG